MEPAKEPIKEPAKPRKSTLPDWAKPGQGPAPEAGKKAPASVTLTTPMLGLAAGIGLLLVLVAFSMGWSSGKKSGTAAADAKYKEEIARITRNMTHVQGGGAQAPATGAKTAAAPVPAKADPREAGLSYWLLCQAPAADARKYADFLAAEGRRTLLVTVPARAGAKTGAPVMMALFSITRGYRPTGDRVEVEKGRTELLALGDKWAKKHKGGNPFRGLRLDVYKP